MTFVRFVGYRLELNNLLKYFTRKGTIAVSKAFRISLTIPSGPGDLLFYRCLIAVFTSSSLISEGKKTSSTTDDSPSFSECSEGKFSTPELKRFSKWAYQSSMEMLLVTVGFLLCFLI